MNRDGRIDKYKARLVVQGFSQVEGVNYFETYSSVANYTTIRYIMSHCAQMKLHIVHVDINNAFLNAKLEDEIYVRLPTNINGKVVKLKMSLYD